MKTHLIKFKESFKLKKEFLYFLLIDGLFCGLTALFLFLTEKFVTDKYNNFAQGQSVEQVKEFLVTAPPEQLASLLSELKIYFFSVFGSIFLFCLATFMLFTLSQAVIWHLLAQKKLTRKNYFKWLLLMPVAALIFILTIIIFIVFRLLVLSVLPNNFYLQNFVGVAVNLLYFLAFLFFFFLLCQQFTHHHKVFQCLADTFHTIKQHFKPLLIAYLFSFVLSAALSFLLYLIMAYALPLQPYLVYFNLLITLSFLAWLRLYLIKIHPFHAQE